MKKIIFILAALLSMSVFNQSVQANEINEEYLQLKLANDVYVNTDYLSELYTYEYYEDEEFIGYNIHVKETRELVEKVYVEKEDPLVLEVTNQKNNSSRMSNDIVPMYTGTYWTTLYRTTIENGIDVTIAIDALVYYWNSFRQFNDIGDSAIRTTDSNIDIVSPMITNRIDSDNPSKLFTRYQAQLRTTSAVGLSLGWIVGYSIGGNKYYYKNMEPKNYTFSLYPN